MAKLPMPDSADFCKVVGETIRLWRVLSGYTQLGLAEEVGLSRTTIVNIEAGKQNITLQVAAEIAAVFGVSIDEIVAGEGPPEEEDLG